MSVTALIAAVFLGSCKPADEPMRADLGATAGAGRAGPVALDAGPGPASLGTIRLVTPDAGAFPPATDPRLRDAAVTGPVAGEVVDGDALASPLAAAVRAVIAVPPTEEARATADAANKAGLRHHRKLDLIAAVRSYDAALAAWPGHVFANYNLACASALRGERDRAIHHLEVLAALDSEASRGRLLRATTDEDFASLLEDARFRALTGYLPVEVSWSPTTSSSSAADEIARRLRAAEVAAGVGKAWRKDVTRDTLYVRIDDDAAAEIADRVVAALGEGLQRLDSKYLDEARPLVLVLSGDAVAAAGGDEEAGSVDAWVGVKMTARPDGAVEHLHLKRTGFFRWERLEDAGRRVERTGRYHLEGSTLSLDYRQVTETPTSSGDPDLEVEQGRRSSHDVSAGRGTLIVDGIRFKRGG